MGIPGTWDATRLWRNETWDATRLVTQRDLGATRLGTQRDLGATRRVPANLSQTPVFYRRYSEVVRRRPVESGRYREQNNETWHPPGKKAFVKKVQGDDPDRQTGTLWEVAHGLHLCQRQVNRPDNLILHHFQRLVHRGLASPSERQCPRRRCPQRYVLQRRDPHEP